MRGQRGEVSQCQAPPTHSDEPSALFPPQNQYKSDLSFMKGVAWDGVGAPQMESAKKAGDLLSEVRMGESGSGWGHLICVYGGRSRIPIFKL